MTLPVPFPFSGQFSIRLLANADIPLLEWHGGADLRTFYHDLWQFHQTGEATVLIADLNGFPAGQIVIHWSGKPAHLDFPDQQSLRVHPMLRGFGVGSRLIETSEQFVAGRGYKSVGLSVSVENHAARRLYERLGYGVIGESYEDRWSFVNARGETVEIQEIVVDLVKKLGK